VQKKEKKKKKGLTYDQYPVHEIFQFKANTSHMASYRNVLHIQQSGRKKNKKNITKKIKNKKKR
jgi:hypothetical protein